MELVQLRKKIFQSRCNLCKMGERDREVSDLIAKTFDGKRADELDCANFNEPLSAKLQAIDELLNADLIEKSNTNQAFNTGATAFPNFLDMKDIDSDLLKIELNILNSTDAH